MPRADGDETEIVALAFVRHKRKGWQRANCPLCLEQTGKRDERKSLGLNFSTGGFICQKCGITGICRDLVDEVELHDREDAVVAPALELKPIEPCEGFCPLRSEPWSSAWATSWARDYLASRGVAEETIAEAHAGCVVAGRHAGRVVIPHLATNGLVAPEAWLGWIGRQVIGHSELKYRYSKGMGREVLWNERALAEDTDEPLLLVEGTFDALPYWPNVCAFLGKPTRHHLATLAAHRGRPLVWCLDGDAWEEGWGYYARTRFAGAPTWHVRLPPGEDPSSLGPAAVYRLVGECLASGHK